jgi:carboxymethylenebutenolidase
VTGERSRFDRAVFPPRRRRPRGAARVRAGALVGFAVALTACAGGRTEAPRPSAAGVDVTYARGEYELHGRLCKPEGPGPFPAVVYNHGGVVDKVVGAPAETCAALARAGFVGFSPIRRPTWPFMGHPLDVEAALDYVEALPYVDAARLGLIGFSSGATVTFVVAAHRADVDAVVIMATAGGEARMHVDTSAITAPVLVLVAKNDTGADGTFGHDAVASSEALVARLRRTRREVTYKVYPPYGRDGHSMFFEVGAYWPDVVDFLKGHL